MIISTLGAALFLFLVNASDVFQNTRKLPDEVRKTVSQYRSWVKEDNEWTGNWSSSPEGLVDLEDMRLSDVDMEITIWAEEGQIDGTMSTKAICRAVPLNFILLRGSVSGNTAKLIAWDMVLGHKVDFAELRLEREGDVVTVTPISGEVSWFPRSARLGKHPIAEGEQPEPDSTFCAEEMRERIEKFRSLPIPHQKRDSG